jgi:glycosyltransferase involved in cell wall biosynthesis
MRVLIFHGYLLRGTGSNVYNASLAQALAKLGHDVHLLCQDREAEALPWVSAVGGWKGGELEVREVRESPEKGAVTAYRPEIGGLLPVYVHDRYEGFDVKVFPDLTDAELDRYLDSNVAAVRDVAGRGNPPGAALANHLVMGPPILARAGLEGGFAAKVHGSALEYTVKPNPRFLPLAREGMAAANGVLVGSRHTAESLWKTIADPSLPARTRLGPPGVDVELFTPMTPEQSNAEMRRLAERLEGAGAEGSFGRDPGRAAEAIRWFEEGSGGRVVYVGKLIPAKGVDHLLRAWPLVEAEHPDARLLVVGFGEQETELEAMAGGQVGFAGRLEHEELPGVVAGADAIVVPSVFPEAFGMVAAEGAAAGALPVSAGHSGLAEVSAAIAERLPDEIAPLVSYPPAEDASKAIASRLDRWLGLSDAEREPVRDALAETVRELWSWEGVARGVLAASAGELGGLPEVPDA